MRKALTWAGLIIAVIWMIKNPTGAAADVRQVIGAISHFVSAL